MTMTNTIFQRYAPAIFSILVLLLGGYQALQGAGYGLVAILQFVVLVATTATTYFVPMVNSRYAGWVKVLFEVLGVVATAVIPFVVDNHITRAQVILVVIAIVKALATHFGVAIRNDVTPPVELSDVDRDLLTRTAEVAAVSISDLPQQEKLALAAQLQQDATTESDVVSLGDGLAVDETK